MENEEFPGISDRIKANTTDYLVLCILLMAVTSFSESRPDLPLGVRISLFVFIFLVYDPLFTTLFGGTIGHYMNGIRVKRADDRTRNIPFHAAVIRYILKVFLGIISFITINSQKSNSAIHDYAADSIVIFKDKSA